MATYQHENGETAITVNGSTHDRRLTTRDDWTLVDDAGTDDREAVEPPARNAPTEDWQEYAIQSGMPESEARQASRADLIAHYTDTA